MSDKLNENDGEKEATDEKVEQKLTTEGEERGTLELLPQEDNKPHAA